MLFYRLCAKQYLKYIDFTTIASISQYQIALPIENHYAIINTNQT